MLFFCFVAASSPQEQYQLQSSRASPEREAYIREAYTSAHELATGVAREQAAIDTMSLEMIEAQVARLLQRRDMLCNSAERTVQQNGTSTASADLCNSTTFVPRALELSAQRQDGADAVTSSDTSAGRDPGAELCPGHPNILLSSPSCKTASTSKAREDKPKAREDEPCPGHPHILRSSPTCLEKTAADPSDARLADSKKHDGASVSPKTPDDAPKETHGKRPPPQQQQQQQGHGIGQQGSLEPQGKQGGEEGQSEQEDQQNHMLDMEAVLVICISLIVLTMFFEWLRHFLQKNIPHMMSHIVTALFGELTVLGSSLYPHPSP